MAWNNMQNEINYNWGILKKNIKALVVYSPLLVKEVSIVWGNCVF